MNLLTKGQSKKMSVLWIFFFLSAHKHKESTTEQRSNSQSCVKDTNTRNKMFLDLTEQTIFIITLSLSTDPSFLYRFFYVEKYICVDGGQQQIILHSNTVHKKKQRTERISDILYIVSISRTVWYFGRHRFWFFNFFSTLLLQLDHSNYNRTIAWTRT